MKSFLTTGGLGFIGSHLVDALLSDPQTEKVVVIDDFSSGKMEHLMPRHLADENHGRLEIIRFNLVEPIYNYETYLDLFKGIDCLFHLSANPDARRGIENTRLDLELETVVTYNVLEAMRRAGSKKIIFASSGTIYGDSGLNACREGFGERLPISLYGAGKLASEGLISAYCGTFGMSSVIFRFGNCVGERCTHGAIFDFINQLREHPDYLDVLGNGIQSKPYLYVKEVVAGMIHGLKIIDWTTDGFCQPFNLAPSDSTTVNFIASTLVGAMNDDRRFGVTNHTKINYGSTPAGWAGDVPHSRMDMSKLVATGFRLERSSDEAVKHAISEILKSL